MLNGKPRTTATAKEAADLVRPLAKGFFAGDVTLTVADERVREIHGYWQVPLIPSHWPYKTSPLYEDLAIIEDGLREQGVDDIILALAVELPR